LRARGASIWALAAALAVLGAVATGSWVIWTNPGPSSSAGSAPAKQERNWIWWPTAEDLRWAEGVEGGVLYVRGPIVDEATGGPLEGDVFINGELVAEGVEEVSVLMWNTVERPVFVQVEVEGYHPWQLRFRFHHRGLSELVGPVRLKLKGGSDE